MVSFVRRSVEDTAGGEEGGDRKYIVIRPVYEYEMALVFFYLGLMRELRVSKREICLPRSRKKNPLPLALASLLAGLRRRFPKKSLSLPDLKTLSTNAPTSGSDGSALSPRCDDDDASSVISPSNSR